LHISQICENRNQKVEEVLEEGQPITVFCSGIDKQGRVKLEWKEKPGAKATEAVAPVEAESSAVSGDDAS
jgi:polyribonucleotide nucleotidyltransferase